MFYLKIEKNDFFYKIYIVNKLKILKNLLNFLLKFNYNFNSFFDKKLLMNTHSN